MILAGVAGYLFSPIGKIVMVALACLTVLVGAWGMLKIHDAGVRRQAQLEWNQKQLEVLIENQRRIAEQMRRIQQIQEEELERLRKAKEEADKAYADLIRWIESPEAGEDADKPASKFLREFIRRLQRGE